MQAEAITRDDVKGVTTPLFDRAVRSRIVHSSSFDNIQIKAGHFYYRFITNSPQSAIYTMNEISGLLPATVTEGNIPVLGMLVTPGLLTGQDGYRDGRRLYEDISQTLREHPDLGDLRIFPIAQLVDCFGDDCLGAILNPTITDPRAIRPKLQVELLGEKAYAAEMRDSLLKNGYVIVAAKNQAVADALGLGKREERQPGVPIEERLKAIETPKEKLGEGHFTEVWEVVRADGSRIAVKVPKEWTREGGRAEGMIANERTALQVLRNRGMTGITELAQPYPDEAENALAMKMVEGKALKDRISQLRPEERIGAIQTIVEKVLALHRNGVAHRDIKSENFLGDDLILGDFAEREIFPFRGDREDRLDLLVQTLCSEGGKSDWAAVGRVIYEVLTGEVLPSDIAKAKEMVARRKGQMIGEYETLAVKQGEEVQGVLTAINMLDQLLEGKVSAVSDVILAMKTSHTVDELKLIEAFEEPDKLDAAVEHLWQGAMEHSRQTDRGGMHPKDVKYRLFEPLAVAINLAREGKVDMDTVISGIRFLVMDDKGPEGIPDVDGASLIDGDRTVNLRKAFERAFERDGIGILNRENLFRIIELLRYESRLWDIPPERILATFNTLDYSLVGSVVPELRDEKRYRPNQDEALVKHIAWEEELPPLRPGLGRMLQ